MLREKWHREAIQSASHPGHLLVRHVAPVDSSVSHANETKLGSALLCRGGSTKRAPFFVVLDHSSLRATSSGTAQPAIGLIRSQCSQQSCGWKATEHNQVWGCCKCLQDEPSAPAESHEPDTPWRGYPHRRQQEAQMCSVLFHRAIARSCFDPGAHMVPSCSSRSQSLILEKKPMIGRSSKK